MTNQPVHLYVNIGGHVFCMTDVLGTYQVVPMVLDKQRMHKFTECYLKATDLLNGGVREAMLITDLARDPKFAWGSKGEIVVNNTSIKDALECELLYDEYKDSIIARSEWVYVLEAKDYGLYKIGMTTKYPDERVAHFAPKLPFETDIIARIPTPNDLVLESQIHEQLKSKRVRGEWFELDVDDISQLTTMSVDTEIIYGQ